ncbi:chloride channel protein [uncultured Clostridium sp.]|jgi:H+/Cl- antiporter ClcA|uniref:chloride channel protein n=1 Tax=uncultured Clostridium sp. TaxID=59620 RepID=UPI0026280DB7|nr:chloride channel protein [uncultured Clostridium sp.]
MKRYLNFGISILYSAIIGAFVGFITWLFLTLAYGGIDLIWYDFIFKFNSKFLVFAVCVIGGVLVGLIQKYLGKYPKTMPVVLGEFKEKKSVEYKSIPKGVLAAFTVLWSGASLGPEAALTGIIGGLATLAGDFLKFGLKRRKIDKELEEILTESSMEATIGLIFGTPLYGFYNLINDKSKISIKRAKIIIYTVTIAVGFAVFLFLSKIDNRASFIKYFGDTIIGQREVIFLIPLFAVGILATFYYNALGTLLHKIFKPLENYKVIKAIIGGVVLGGLAITVPYILFSGEGTLEDLIVNWQSVSVITLLLIFAFKLVATEVCLSTGWLGGHIFPVMFSGAALGYAVSVIFNINPVFATCVIMTTFLAGVMRNALIAIFLLVFFFPINLTIYLIASAFACKFVFDKIFEVKK